jgi:hypothetical protein
MAEGYAPPPGTVEVLEWLPREIVPDWPDGMWSLEALGEWLNLDLEERRADCRQGGADADPGALAAWAGEQLGYQVRLTPEDDIIGVPRVPAFAGRNKVTRAINVCLPARQVSRRLYWVIPV